MATLLQRIGATLGLGDNEPLVSGNIAPQGTTNAAFHLDIHGSGTVSSQIFVARSNGATLISENDQRGLLIGGSGDDRLLGGEQTDLLIGGRGANAMSGGGGTDTFGHTSGATDVITDFSPSADEKIALQDGLSLSGSRVATADPAVFGLTGNPASAMTLTLSDGSEIVLLGVTETPVSDWFI